MKTPRPTPETDKFFATFADGEAAPSHAEYYARLQDLERERDEARGQRDKAIAMLWRLNVAATVGYNAAFDYSNPPREQYVLSIINEVEEFLSTQALQSLTPKP